MTSPGATSQSGLRYRPIIALGHGGMADVLLSVGRGPSGFNKLVVLKTMRKELVFEPEMRQMFLEEARLSARLSHPNVVQVYEVVDTILPCIIMEYLDGQTMAALLREAGERYSMPLQLKVISETLTGLHYSHELKDYDGKPLNIVHRDVSPQNVLITYDGTVKVLDFGIAKAADGTSRTSTGVVKGKVNYMPREQLLNEPTDRRADVYAVGCLLWHAAAGEKLWGQMPDGEIMRALIEGKIPKPSEKRPVDPRLEAIVMKALAAEPEDRYDTALQLRQAVDQYLADNSPQVTMREVGDLVSEVFAEQHAARKKQIHATLSAPRSETPPPIPEGIEAIVQSATGNSLDSLLVSVKRQRLTTVGAAILAAVLAAGGVTVFVSRRSSHAQVSHSATVSPPAQIHIQLAASPAVATLAVDGNPLRENPASLTETADGRDHEIRATLIGYETYSKTVRFERDLSLEIMLQPSAASAGTAATATSANSADTTAATKAIAVTASKVTRAPAAGAKRTKLNCDPPFYFENGIKVYKPGCL